jgi:protein O-GlcNAc transferase
MKPWVHRLLTVAGRFFGKKGQSGIAVLMFRARDRSADFEYGLSLWNEERIDEAEQVLLKVLDQTPQHAQTNNLLGAIYLRRGQESTAETFIRQAIAAKGDYAAAHNNLGNIFLARHDTVRAMECYETALLHDPNYAESLTNLGNVFTSIGKYNRAEECCRRAIKVAPTFAGAHCNLGSALLSLGRGGEAVAAYREALRLCPGLPEALINLSLVLQEPGYLVGVIDHYEDRLKKWPEDYQSHLRIAQALQAQDLWDDGRSRLMQALDIRPNAPDALLLLGHNDAHAGNAMGAIDFYQKVLLLDQNAAAHSGILFNLLYLADQSGEDLRIECAKWAERYAPPRPSAREHIKIDERKALRVGYVSKDFALHSVAYFLEPILAHHNPAIVFSVCYSTQLQPDAMTTRFQSLAGIWRDVSLLSIDQLEMLVIEDEIDILVDLSGHTSGNRLELFSRRPAPIQITYLGHPATTGLTTIDYRIGDEVTDPLKMTESHYTEQLWRLPGCFLTYRPPDGIPISNLPPCIGSGHITFGSFNNALKITDDVIATWTSILHAVPSSRLILKSFAFGTKYGKHRLLDAFVRQGIDELRIELMAWLPTGVDHLSIYQNVDIALDTFPYNGTTTTCEAMWMGVPVICLEGQRHSSRVGASLLTALGLTELLATNREDYILRAVALANDRARLMSIRQGLRGRMQSSPLLDHRGFTRNLETTYQKMWRGYCQWKINDSPAFPTAQQTSTKEAWRSTPFKGNNVAQ